MVLAEDLISDIWTYADKQVGSYAQLTNLPEDVRARLAEAFLDRAQDNQDLLTQLCGNGLARLNHIADQP